MLTSNNLCKIISSGRGRITTDDIPEGTQNKYAVDYVEGKSIGDIVIRNTPDELPCHALLNGQVVHAYEYPTFYSTLKELKELGKVDAKYEFFNKTESEYDNFLELNVFEQTEQHYCPYFVINEVEVIVYEVQKDGKIGYTPLEGEKNNEVLGGFIYTDNTLETVLDRNDGWVYTANIASSVDKYVKLPTYPTYTNGNIKSYYFIVISSRIDDEKTAIRSVTVGQTETLEPDRNAYIKNVGTLQNLVLDFGIPRGSTPTISVGSVTSDDYVDVTNVGTPTEAIFNFTLRRGPQGPAGGVMILDSIGPNLPTNAQMGDKHYNTSDNNIYEYNNEWVILTHADDGMIYINNNKVYHFNKEELVEFNNIINLDNTTMNKNQDGTITSIGTLTKNGKLMYDWIGTEQEWEAGRATGVIQDDWVCFITND